MAKLPQNPNLNHLKNEAKQVLRAHKERDASVCSMLRHHEDFADKSDAQVFATPLSLTQAQFALALDYGFKSWQDLKNFVDLNNQLRSELTEDDWNRLQIWVRGSSMGKKEIIHRTAKQPVFRELLELEKSLEPISPIAWRIRRKQQLEPPDFEFIEHVDSCIASIGQGQMVPIDRASVEERHRKQIEWVEKTRKALQGWQDGLTPEETKKANPDCASHVDEVFSLLGDPDEDKRSVVEMVIPRIDRETRDLTIPNQIADRLGTWDPKESKNLQELFFHEITRLDLDTWFTEKNIQITLGNIGKKALVQETFCWVNNPDNQPLQKLRIKAIQDWVDDKRNEPDTASIVAVLGDKDAYNEKVWLARSLMVQLECKLTTNPFGG